MARNFWSFVMLAGNVLLLALVLLTAGNMLHMRFPYSYYLPATSPGVLAEESVEDPFWWLTLGSFFLRLLFLVVAIQRLVKPPNRTYFWIHLIVLILAIAMDLVYFIWHFFEIDDCNTASGPIHYNRCSDDRWCCVFAVAPPDPYCPVLLSPCSPAVGPADLGWNARFLWSFALCIAAFVLYLLHLIVTFFLGTGAVAMVDPQCVEDPCLERKKLIDAADSEAFTSEDLEFVQARIGALRASGQPYQPVRIVELKAASDADVVRKRPVFGMTTGQV